MEKKIPSWYGCISIRGETCVLHFEKVQCGKKRRICRLHHQLSFITRTCWPWLGHQATVLGADGHRRESRGGSRGGLSLFTVIWHEKERQREEEQPLRQESASSDASSARGSCTRPSCAALSAVRYRLSSPGLYVHAISGHVTVHVQKAPSFALGV